MNTNEEQNENMELILENILAHDRKCIGCRNHERDIMLSFIHDKDTEKVHDLFLTQAQAIDLLAGLKAAIERNGGAE